MIEALAATLVFLAVVVLVVVPTALVRRRRGAPERQPREPMSGWEYVLLGTVASAVGGGLLVSEGPVLVSAALLFLGGVLTTAGTIAIGVVVGMRRLQTNP